MLYRDQLDRPVSIIDSPKRIISLVPSQTKLLVDLGLEDRIVGVTKFCVHPAWIRKTKKIVGGTKNFRFDVIESLNPDLIIGNKEENDQDEIEKLMRNYPVWMSDIITIEESLEMILLLGEILDARSEADKIVQKIKNDFATPLPKKGSAAYVIWYEPIMVAGSKTFINEMMALAGFENKISKGRYPIVNLKDLKELAPEYILLSSEPYPFKKKHVDYFNAHLPKSKIRLIDGELFSWYGSRLLDAKSYFLSLID